MRKNLKQGDPFPRLEATTIHGGNVVIPDDTFPYVHLQFRRFAGCPICNFHLRTFVPRMDEIALAGIKEVVVFHSSAAELLIYQAQFPFDVIGDPEKKLYKQYGVGTSIASILSTDAWPAIRESSKAKDNPTLSGFPKGGPLGLPADFLVSAKGIITAVKYGNHAYDQWSVNELLSILSKVAA